jgi:hypothetical protein
MLASSILRDALTQHPRSGSRSTTAYALPAPFPRFTRTRTGVTGTGVIGSPRPIISQAYVRIDCPRTGELKWKHNGSTFQLPTFYCCVRSRKSSTGSGTIRRATNTPMIGRSAGTTSRSRCSQLLKCLPVVSTSSKRTMPCRSGRALSTSWSTSSRLRSVSGERRSLDVWSAPVLAICRSTNRASALYPLNAAVSVRIKRSS